MSASMALTEWTTPPARILTHCPQPASLAALFDTLSSDESTKLENFCDVVLNIEPDITPELAAGGVLRAFTYAMVAAEFRFFEERLLRYGRDPESSKVNDLMCRSAIRVRLADSTPGAAEKILCDFGSRVRTRFEADNLPLTMLPGGIGGMESVVMGIQTLATSLTQLGESLSSADSDFFEYVLRFKIAINYPNDIRRPRSQKFW